MIQAHIVVKIPSLTPSLSSLALGRGHGHPHKEILPPTYDDYPHGASKAEIQRYFKCKGNEMWRFQKLMSGDGSEFRRKWKRTFLEVLLW